MKKTAINSNKLAGFVAIFISLLALSVSIYEANLMRDQQSAMIWPYVQIEPKYDDKGFSIAITNKGTGPAIIQSVEMRYNEQLVIDFNELFDLMNPERNIGYNLIKASGINNRVLSAGENSRFLFIPWTEEGEILIDEFANIELNINYCSVNNKCWVLEIPSGKRKVGDFKARTEFIN